MKIMAILAVFLVAVLCMGAVSAQSVVNVEKDAANAPEIGEGTFILINSTAAIGNGVTFVLSGANDIVTDENSQITITKATKQGTYSNNAGYNFTVFMLPEKGFIIDTPESTAKGTVFNFNVSQFGYNGSIVTVTFGDNSAAVTKTVNPDKTTDYSDILTIDHTYEAAGTYKVSYTIKSAAGEVLESGYAVASVIAPTAEVNTVDHNATFVYQTVKVLDATGNTGNPVKKLYFYSSDSTPTLIATMESSTGIYDLLEAAVNGHYGAWYGSEISGSTLPTDYITIWYPEISLKAELTTGSKGVTSGDSVDGKTINKNTQVSFLIEAPNVGPANIATVKIVFTTPASGKTTAFGYDTLGDPVDFKNIGLSKVQTVAKGTGVTAGEDAVAGTWTAQAEFTSPKGFSDNAKKTNTISFTLQSTSLVLTAAKDSVVRSNPFTVSIQGDSKMVYFIYLDGADANDANPTLQSAQSGMITAAMSIATIGGQPIFDGTGLADTWGYFETDASGKRTVQYNTAADTEDKTYTIKVYETQLTKTQAEFAGVAEVKGMDYDSVKVKVEKGAVTISASGDGSYYIGDEIKLTGTNTDSDYIFLFLTGQNLNENGIVLKDLPTKTAAKFGAGQYVSVKTDDTWEYKWDTSRIALDTGAYTIYATSKITNGKSSSPEDVVIKNGDVIVNSYTAVKLSDSEYATVSINLKQPFLSAVPSGTIVAKGDKIYIRGTAEGDPSNLKLYIFGPNFFDPYTITVEDDGSYEKKIDISSTMSSNQYFVVVQHPMYNNEFDAYLVDTTNPGTTFTTDSTDQWAFKTRNTTTGGDAQSFIVWGSANKLQGSQAADALTKMIDSANIDDIYTKLTFTVAEPWIKITNPGDKATGSKFTISGTTNLAVDDQILVEVMSSSFSAVDKTSTSTTSGVSQTTKVVAGEGTDNTWSVEVDTTNWKLDEYTIKVQGIEVDVTTTTNFNLVEKLPDTPKPTETGAPATTTATATATTAPTQTPGFGAFVALAGLGAVALLVLRRN
ncbi:PGF-CTERM sorting domain-containing protein [Methanocorpusculum sp. MG]|uniref:PGF-CTERM sorting domain-containing protein n=1 Tax=Methanocorpusculum petauri TaxID=3002863 RepID=A0ABT4IJI4_9EURY|nr:MEMAR_RS02690 family S-layer glycoprotein [Methanocorpusculum petauri]MCZ0861258.1 PGF-CTERM sorting domain-containing protein [Methanocorpusculum petauri]